MKVQLKENTCVVQREETDPKLYKESTFYYHLKKELQRQGYDVICKRMHKDGHLYGDDTLPYIRSRKKTGKGDFRAFCVYDGEWAVRNIYQKYNSGESVGLLVDRDIFARE